MKRARTDATKRFYVAIGERITETRQRLGITQEALASDISLTRTAVVNIEHGKQQLLVHTLVKISRALKVSPDELLPDFSPDEGESVLKVISNKIEDKKAREWVVKRVKEADMGRS